ncbi:hypothetical protein D3C72_739870 [compost metagenome]
MAVRRPDQHRGVAQRVVQSRLALLEADGVTVTLLQVAHPALEVGRLALRGEPARHVELTQEQQLAHALGPVQHLFRQRRAAGAGQQRALLGAQEVVPEDRRLLDHAAGLGGEPGVLAAAGQRLVAPVGAPAVVGARRVADQRLVDGLGLGGLAQALVKAPDPVLRGDAEVVGGVVLGELRAVGDRLAAAPGLLRFPEVVPEDRGGFLAPGEARGDALLESVGLGDLALLAVHARELPAGGHAGLAAELGGLVVRLGGLGPARALAFHLADGQPGLAGERAIHGDDLLEGRDGRVEVAGAPVGAAHAVQGHRRAHLLEKSDRLAVLAREVVVARDAVVGVRAEPGKLGEGVDHLVEVAALGVGVPVLHQRGGLLAARLLGEQVQRALGGRLALGLVVDAGQDLAAARLVRRALGQGQPGLMVERALAMLLDDLGQVAGRLGRIELGHAPERPGAGLGMLVAGLVEAAVGVAAVAGLGHAVRGHQSGAAADQAAAGLAGEPVEAAGQLLPVRGLGGAGFQGAVAVQQGREGLQLLFRAGEGRLGVFGGVGLVGGDLPGGDRLFAVAELERCVAGPEVGFGVLLAGLDELLVGAFVLAEAVGQVALGDRQGGLAHAHEQGQGRGDGGANQQRVAGSHGLCSPFSAKKDVQAGGDGTSVHFSTYPRPLRPMRMHEDS